MTQELRLEAMAAALAGQESAGRRHPREAIAWCVEEGDSVIALDIGRWTATGRVVHRRYTWSWLPKHHAMTFEFFGQRWMLVGGSYDVIPADEPPPRHAQEDALALRTAALTRLRFDHAPVLSAKARSRAATITRGNAHNTNKKFMDAIFAAWPAGYHMLPAAFGQTPKLYQVCHNAGDPLYPETAVLVRKPKTAVAQKNADPLDDKSWIATKHTVRGGLARIYGVDYALTPCRTMVYRPGGPEDCWSFPEMSSEAELRFAELRPVGSVKLPGCLAWYLTAETRRVVRITWYNSRRDAVHDYAAVGQGGAVSWMGHQFMLMPDGVLVTRP